MHIAVLTTKKQWFEPFAKKLANKLKCELFVDHNGIENFDIVFILSYHKIVPKNILDKNKHNVVVHASALPKGKGWSPMFWQILEGKNNIPFSMFEAGNGVDNGAIYMQKTLQLTGYELHDELRIKQANFIINMCIDFINNFQDYKYPIPQKGNESFYPKRTPKDAQLDIKKSIEEQFNLFRICSNKEYPAFFKINNKKYILKIEEA